MMLIVTIFIIYFYLSAKHVLIDLKYTFGLEIGIDNDFHSKFMKDKIEEMINSTLLILNKH